MKYGVSFNTDFLLNWILTINQADLIKLVQKKETHVDKAFSESIQGEHVHVLL